MESTVLDFAIVGAGISGINMAYRLQESLPSFKYAIFEGRSEMGGTWSLFKYPGIRSDSDLFTFGFSFEPWTKDSAIADASSILSYLKYVTAKHGIDQHISYNHYIDQVNWSTEEQRWQITALVNSECKTYSARFLCMATGYYDYKQPLSTTIPNISAFQGLVVHPQFWPENLDYTDKRVVIIGSGATAVTLLPAMSTKAQSVVMLQRSPSYFFAPPVVENINRRLRRWLPKIWAYQLIRLRMIILGQVFYQLCHAFPNWMRTVLQSSTAKQLPKNIPLSPNFVPTYNPWQQRMCITPGGDFFTALRSGKTDIVTDTIANITPTGITLSSGRQLPADIIITATGLKVRFGSATKFFIDGEAADIRDKFIWKGALLQDIPNFAFVFGYVHASWTLGADVTARLFVRIIRKAVARNMASFMPQMAENEKEKDRVKPVHFVGLQSTYIRKAMGEGELPKSGDRGPWVPRTSYLWD